jgi:hypothetical protein
MFFFFQIAFKNVAISERISISINHWRQKTSQNKSSNFFFTIFSVSFIITGRIAHMIENTDVNFKMYTEHYYFCIKYKKNDNTIINIDFKILFCHLFTIIYNLLVRLYELRQH